MLQMNETILLIHKAS